MLRLRVTLTAIFTATLAIGLLILATIAIRTDSNSRVKSLDSDMLRRAVASSRLLYYSNRGKLRLDGVRGDDVTVGKPEIRALLVGDGGVREVFRGRGPHLPLTAASVDEIARRAAGEQKTVRLDSHDRDGKAVRMIATPFYDDSTGRPAGAVLSAASSQATADAHRDLVLAMAFGCGALILLAAGAGWLLAGRSLRPAAKGIADQEALLADAAHELRNPAASITAVLEAAEMDPSSREAALRTALEASRRMGETIDTLLLRARARAGADPVRRVPLRLDQLVADQVAELQHPRTGLELRAEPSVVEGDPRLIRIAVRNLLDNAARHGRNGEGPAEIEVAVEGATVTVADRGPGPPGQSEDGFHRFRESSPGGTGLGLSIAAWVAESQGGTLRLDPREGGGTVAALGLSPAR